VRPGSRHISRISAWLKSAQQRAAHESARTTALYDRRSDEVSLDKVERIWLKNRTAFQKACSPLYFFRINKSTSTPKAIATIIHVCDLSLLVLVVVVPEAVLIVLVSLNATSGMA
jgi:hypothetical protein